MADFVKSASIVKVIDAQSVKAAIEIEETNLIELIAYINTAAFNKQTGFESTGIDDNATETAITIGSDEVTTFGQIPVTPSAAPTTDYQVANKKYVDDKDFFPSGGIIMWSGAISAIPSGWLICDGTNSTPDLTDRFVIHADADSGGTNNVGDTGGSNTIAEANLPTHTHDDGTLATDTEANHTHSYYASTSGGNWANTSAYTSRSYTNTSAAGAHSHDVTGSTGNGGFANNDFKPKYYALAYIMKS